MRAKVLRKINNGVRIIEQDGLFVMQTRRKILFGGYTDWVNANQFSTYKQALKQKHSYIVMILMRELGLRNEFVRRRTKRKNND